MLEAKLIFFCHFQTCWAKFETIILRIWSKFKEVITEKFRIAKIWQELTAHVFFAQDTFLGGPLESSNDWILNFIEILDSLCAIHDDIRASTVGTEAPDFTSFCDVLESQQKEYLSNFLQ